MLCSGRAGAAVAVGAASRRSAAAAAVLRPVRPSAAWHRALSVSTVVCDAADSVSDGNKNASSSGFLSAESSYADPSYTNRWAMAVPAFMTHLAIGTPWAWSVLSGIITNEHGFVTSAASDWSMMETTMPMSIVFMIQGLVAATCGKYQMKVGPRMALMVSALCFGGGMGLSALGVATHSLPLLYGGYGLLAGTGVGLAYTPPVQALVEWFPDRRATATGLTIAGFGCGALAAAPFQTALVKYFAKLPQFLGADADVVSQDGKLFSDVGGQLKEVVVATAADLNKLPYEGLQEGVYVVGSGNTGVAAALAVTGAVTFGIMAASALVIRRPAVGYVPEGYTPPDPTVATTTQSGGNVNVDTVMKTPQYKLLATTFFCVACGGMGLFAVAKPMMSEIFSSTLPLVVTSAFAGGYVLALSAGNLGGRLGWAAVSDVIGRRPTFHVFTMASVPLYLAVPYFIHQVVESGSTVGLYGFIGSTVVAVTIMGGVYAILPAYEADLFGVKYVGPNHGRMLLASSAAALAGPSLLVALRSSAESKAIYGLVDQVDPSKFEAAFGATTDQAKALIESRTLTIPKLMDVVPAGVQDPSPFIYDSTMYTMAGLMSVAALAHLAIGPIDPKFYEDNVAKEAQAQATAAAAAAVDGTARPADK